jgi:ferric-dicitrate binding protein FerR (iron transport regulator)
MTDREGALVIEPHFDDPLALSRSLVQIMDMLQLYQAEVARILDVRCADVASLAQARTRLTPHTHAWRQACLLLRCYRALHDECRGDAAAMYHWLHRDLPGVGVTPHRLMVDEQALAAVVAHLERARPSESAPDA